MIKKILIVFIGILAIACCTSEEERISKIAQKIYYVSDNYINDSYYDQMLAYLAKWDNFTIDHSRAKEAIEKHLGTNPYRVIWKWDTDGDDKIDYLAVEEYMGIIKGIKGGILVNEEGKMLMVIDRDKGFYGPTNVFYDFEKIGYQKGEIECIRILFLKEDSIFKKEDFVEINSIGKTNFIARATVAIRFILLNQDLKIISSSADLFRANNNDYGLLGKEMLGRKRIVDYYNFFFEGTDKVYEVEANSLKDYRKLKAEGKLFSPINFDPEKLTDAESINQYLKEFYKE